MIEKKEKTHKPKKKSKEQVMIENKKILIKQKSKEKKS